ncbi:MAG: penicillin acylase family protein [Chloroflexi bacterium]|nr:penicillin acylase family protein [Chloroflexota bacterium]
MNIHKLLFRLLLGQRLPTTDGELTVQGIRRSVAIRRDRFGVPYINAETDEDAWYALGFCQGQDRSFNLEMLLRAARGTLCELVGPGALATDRLSRRLGFSRLAPKQLAVFNPQVKARFEAFARGINDGISRGRRWKTHEFSLLRAQPSTFEAVDLVAVYLLQSMALSANWDVELVRLRMLELDGPEALTLLDPPYPGWHPVSTMPGVTAGPAADALARDIASLAEVVGVNRASNSWAVSPSKTATGRPILANDPHLVPTLPPHWYLAHVRTPTWGLVGATFAGLPAFPVGHNGHVAWGVTLGLADNSDLFLEQIGEDGASVREGSRFVPCELIEETINVKKSPPHHERVLVTPRGPVVGRSANNDSLALSIKATWLQALPVEGLLETHTATTCEEFRRLFSKWPHISLNLAYADTNGDIGFQLVGQVPRRLAGFGTMPMPGWNDSAGWSEEFVPFEEMPHADTPATGFVATANNQPLPSGQGPFLGVDWLDGYRASRITEIVDARDDWDIRNTAHAQLDTVSIPWREMRDVVLAVEPSTTEAQQALDVLAGWDGVVEIESVGAAVFEFFLKEMIQRIAMAKAPRSWEWAIGRSETPVHSLTLLSGRRVGHLVNILRDRPDGWSDVPLSGLIDESLAAAVTELRGRYGANPNGWRWGHIRPLVLKHPVGRSRWLAPVYNFPPVPCAGDTNTVFQTGADPRDAGGRPLVSPSMRMVLDVGNWDENLFVLPGGQSGNPLSPHYDDQFDLWTRGEGIAIPWSPEVVERVTVSTLTISPER